MLRSSLVVLFVLTLGLAPQSQSGIVPALLANFDADVVGEGPDP